MNSNDNSDNDNSNNKNNNDYNNNDVNDIPETVPEAWMAGDRPTAFERSNTTRRKEMGIINEEDNEAGRRAISPPNALQSQR